MAHPRRMTNFDYHGRIRVFINACTHNRSTAFADSVVAAHVVSLLETSAREGDVEITAYCLMPDHVHLLLAGLSDGSNIPKTVSRWKQFAGFWYARQTSKRLWQTNYWDYVLRDEDQTLEVVQYIVSNPVRAGLVKTVAEYQFIGSDCWSREDLLELSSTTKRPFWWPE